MSTLVGFTYGLGALDPAFSYGGGSGGASNPFAAFGDLREHFTLIDAEGLTDLQPIASITGTIDTVEQATASARPLWVETPGSMRFDGVDDFLQAAAPNVDYDFIHGEPGVQAYTFKYPTAIWIGTRRIFSTTSAGTTPGSFIIFTSSTGGIAGIAGAGYPIRCVFTTGIADTDWHTLIFEHDATIGTVYIDGVSAGTFATRAPYDANTADEFTVGASPIPNQFWDGEIGDMVYYAGGVTSIADLHTLLMERVT